MCQQAHNYYVDIAMCLCMDIVSKSVNMHIYDKHEPSRIVQLQYKICVDLFCCSWNLSSAWCNRFSFQLTVCLSFISSVSRSFRFFLTSLNMKELKLFWCVLLWTNIIEKNCTIQKKELHHIRSSLNHHPSNFHSVIHLMKRFADLFLFLCLRTATENWYLHSDKYKRWYWQTNVGVLFWFFNRSVNFIQARKQVTWWFSIFVYIFLLWIFALSLLLRYKYVSFDLSCVYAMNKSISMQTYGCMLNDDEY